MIESRFRPFWILCVFTAAQGAASLSGQSIEALQEKVDGLESQLRALEARLTVVDERFDPASLQASADSPAEPAANIARVADHLSSKMDASRVVVDEHLFHFFWAEGNGIVQSGTFMERVIEVPPGTYLIQVNSGVFRTSRLDKADGGFVYRFGTTTEREGRRFDAPELAEGFVEAGYVVASWSQVSGVKNANYGNRNGFGFLEHPSPIVQVVRVEKGMRLSISAEARYSDGSVRLNEGVSRRTSRVKIVSLTGVLNGQ